MSTLEKMFPKSTKRLTEFFDAVLELDFEPSERQMVWRGYSFIRSLIF